MAMRTVAQACADLGVSWHTLSLWIGKLNEQAEEDGTAHIEVKRHALDLRLKMIAEEDIERIRAARDSLPRTQRLTRRPYAPVRAPEAREGALTAREVSGDVLALPQPRQRPVRAPLADVTATPEGDVPLYAFAELHGVKRRTADDHADLGRFPSYRRDNPARPKEHPHYLTPEGQRAAAAYWREHSTPGWHPCPDCPHS